MSSCSTKPLGLFPVAGSDSPPSPKAAVWDGRSYVCKGLIVLKKSKFEDSHIFDFGQLKIGYPLGQNFQNHLYEAEIFGSEAYSDFFNAICQKRLLPLQCGNICAIGLPRANPIMKRNWSRKLKPIWSLRVPDDLCWRKQVWIVKRRGRNVNQRVHDIIFRVSSVGQSGPTFSTKPPTHTFGCFGQCWLSFLELNRGHRKADPNYIGRSRCPRTIPTTAARYPCRLARNFVFDMAACTST